MIECPNHALLLNGRLAEKTAVERQSMASARLHSRQKSEYAYASPGADLNAYTLCTNRLCLAELYMSGDAGAAVQVSEPG